MSWPRLEDTEMSETNEIVIYDKSTYEVHARICTEGVSEMRIAQQLDAIYRKLDWKVLDVIHICPENKPSMHTYKAFVEAMRRIPNTPTVGGSRTIAEIVYANYPRYPVAMPSPHKSIVIPCEHGICAKITWLPQKSPAGVRLYSVMVAAADRL